MRNITVQNDLAWCAAAIAALYDTYLPTGTYAAINSLLAAYTIVNKSPPVSTLPGFYMAYDGFQFVVLVTGASTAIEAAGLVAGAVGPPSQTAQGGINAFVYANAIQLLNILNRTAPTEPGNWLLVGHSYGGALVQALALLLRIQGTNAPIQVATFGAPRCVDSKGAASLSNTTAVRVMDVGDQIARFPPHFEEAPLATIALGPIAGGNVNSYVQGPGGVLLYSDGSIAPANLPPLVVPIVDVQLVSWATGNNGFLSNEHFYRTYAARLGYVPTCPCPGIPSNPKSFKGELFLPLTAADLQAGPVAGVALYLEGSKMAFSSVYVPPVYRWKPAKIGVVWYATFQGLSPLTCQSHSQAKSICKALNKSLRVMQNATQLDHTQWSNSWAIYWPAASSTSTGFMPVLTVV